MNQPISSRGPFFEVIGATAVLRCRGVYRQCGVFRRGIELYAKYSAGFVRLYASGTSVPHILLDELITDDATHVDAFDRLSLVEPCKPALRIARAKRTDP